MTRSASWRYRRRVVRTPVARPHGIRIQLVVDSPDGDFIIPRSFLIMNGDIITVSLGAIVEGPQPGDFRRVTMPVTIKANIA